MKVIKTKFRKLNVHSNQRPKNIKIIVLAFIFIIGLIIGAFCVRLLTTNLLQSINTFELETLFVSANQSILYNCIKYFLFESAFLFLSFLFGFCLIGEPFLWINNFVRGIFVGNFVGFIYQKYATQGMLYFVIILLFPMVLSATASLIATHESILTSRDLYKSAYGQKNANGITKLYIVRYAVLLVIILLIAFLYAILLSLFGHKFTLI